MSMGPENLTEKAIDSMVSLKKKTFKTNWLVAGLLGLVFVFSVVVVISRYYDYKASIIIAENQEKITKEKETLALEKDAENTKLIDALVEDAKRRDKLLAALAAQQGELARTRQVVSEKSRRDVETVTAPDREDSQIVSDIKEHTGITAVSVPPNFLFTKADTQALVARSITQQRLESDVASLQTELSLERQKNQHLAESLARTEAALNDTRAVLSDVKLVLADMKETMELYKKAAKKTKWQRVKDFGVKATEIAITAVVVGAIAK